MIETGPDVLDAFSAAVISVVERVGASVVHSPRSITLLTISVHRIGLPPLPLST